MGTAERLEEDLKTAMRAGDTMRRDVIRFARHALQQEQIARNRPLEEVEQVQALQRQARQRRESIEEFRKGKRQDLVDKETAELRVLEEYLPDQMDRDAIAERARQAIQETGAKGPAEMGKVMGRLMPQLRGQADGALVNQVVRELLEAAASG
jgi:hypothetical protein